MQLEEVGGCGLQALPAFPRLLQHPDVPAAAATQRFPPPPSSGGALAVNSQGINRGQNLLSGEYSQPPAM